MTQHCEDRMSPLSQANVFMEIFWKELYMLFFLESILYFNPLTYFLKFLQCVMLFYNQKRKSIILNYCVLEQRKERGL